MLEDFLHKTVKTTQPHPGVYFVGTQTNQASDFYICSGFDEIIYLLQDIDNLHLGNISPGPKQTNLLISISVEVTKKTFLHSHL